MVSVIILPVLMGSLMLGMCKTASAAVTVTQSDVVTIFAPSDDINLWKPGVSYPRIIEIQHNGSANGTLLSTFEMYTSGLSREKPGYPIYKSQDGGKTWNYVTTVRESEAAIQSEWQMFFFELPRKLGSMPAGTIILAAVSIDSGHAIKSAIRLYRSYDVGNTWEQYSTVATGGGLVSGVWEPFLMMLDDGRLVCYYSDSTDYQNHSQMLSYKVSSDGVNWGEAVHFVALKDRTLRPGMATVCRLNNGKYFMTYEMVDEDNKDSGNPVTYRFSDDGLDWGDPEDPGTILKTKQGYVPGSGPYCMFIPGVGKNGRIIVRGCFQTPGAPSRIGTYLYINDQNGEGQWDIMDQPLPYRSGGYSSAMFLSSDDVTLYLVNGVNNDESELDYYKIVFTKLVFSESSVKTSSSTAKESSAATADQSSASDDTSSASTASAAAKSENNSATNAIISSTGASVNTGGRSHSTAWLIAVVGGICLCIAEAAVAIFVILRKKNAATSVIASDGKKNPDPPEDSER